MFRRDCDAFERWCENETPVRAANKKTREAGVFVSVFEGAQGIRLGGLFVGVQKGFIGWVLVLWDSGAEQPLFPEPISLCTRQLEHSKYQMKIAEIAHT